MLSYSMFPQQLQLLARELVQWVDFNQLLNALLGVCVAGMGGGVVNPVLTGVFVRRIAHFTLELGKSYQG